MEPLLGLADAGELELDLSDRHLGGSRPDPLHVGLDPPAEGHVGRAEDHRGRAEVGEGQPRPSGYAIVDLLLEEAGLAGADLQELDALGQPRVDHQVVIGQLRRLPLGVPVEIGDQKQHPLGLGQRDRRRV